MGSWPPTPCLTATPQPYSLPGQKPSLGPPGAQPWAPFAKLGKLYIPVESGTQEAEHLDFEWNHMLCAQSPERPAGFLKVGVLTHSLEVAAQRSKWRGRKCKSPGSRGVRGPQKRNNKLKKRCKNFMLSLGFREQVSYIFQHPACSRMEQTCTCLQNQNTAGRSNFRSLSIGSVPLSHERCLISQSLCQELDSAELPDHPVCQWWAAPF